MRKIFSDEDLKQVEGAVQEAERRTSGEIVPFVVERSGVYPAAYWRVGALGATAGLLAVLVLSVTYAGWGLGWLFTVAGTGIVAAVAALLGVMIVRLLPTVERFFAGADSMASAVRDRAVRAFVDEEVFDTRDRTGILLFISLFEHRVEVVGDTGINARVQPEDWAHVVEDVLVGIRDGSAGRGLIAAVRRCGDLLEAKGVAIREDDTNELSDSVRFGDSEN